MGTHGYAHPKELRGFESPRTLSRFVYDKITIIEGLYAQVIKIKIGGWIDGLGNLFQIQFEQLLVQSLDLYPSFEVILEFLGVEGSDFFNTVLSDVPTQNLFINVGQ